MEALEPGDLNIEGPLACLVDFAVERPKTTKLSHPKPDVDNYVKALWDAVTKKGGYWSDDYQVVWTAITKRWAEPNEVPNSTMEIYVPT